MQYIAAIKGGTFIDKVTALMACGISEEKADTLVGYALGLECLEAELAVDGHHSLVNIILHENKDESITAYIASEAHVAETIDGARLAFVADDLSSKSEEEIAELARNPTTISVFGWNKETREASYVGD